ncbi:hypothetical protein QVD17_35180 [Tagetes erecta]|uniref:Transposase n=1 Tax=Tagetes erecta TaxID=13708 RepID=A0AAD8JZF4_TARER|nr:hypothetical protein QVD17_35180 [Tagetes erecta]
MIETAASSIYDLNCSSKGTLKIDHLTLIASINSRRRPFTLAALSSAAKLAVHLPLWLGLTAHIRFQPSKKVLGFTLTFLSMEWFTDRLWMKKKTNNDGYYNMQYCDNVKLFLDFAYSNETAVDRRVTKHGRTVFEIKCPCFKCQNVFYSSRKKVHKHLLKNGFMDNYTTWHAHGETSIHEVGQSSNTMEVDAATDDDDNGYRRMVLDSMLPSDYNSTQQVNLESNNLEVHAPNHEAKGFYDMLEATDELLWEGEKATDFKKLEAATNFLNWKSMFNVSTACYNHNISMVKALLPKENKLPENFYDTKKSLEKLSLPKERIDVCKNHCMLFYKQDKTLTHCKHCGESRYKSDKNKVSNLVMTYLPIGPRLKKLYMSTKTAKYMTWHSDHKTKDGSMAHPSDGKAWKHFDAENPNFANEIRNVRLGLCTDGFNPNNSNSSPYSLWPVFLTIYNLPPWMSLKDSYVKLSLVIPGRKSPGQNVDVFLRPLIDELKQLYEEGIEVYDAHRKENFMMKAILLWTVSDFPAYAMLSGWSTHGRLACPCCMGDTKAFQLHAGGKPSWFDCHRRFLPPSHPFRRDKNGFLANKSVPSSLGPPPELTGWQIYKQVFNLPTVYEGVLYNPKNKVSNFGITHNWVKKSIFWELEYWPSLLIRHNLDVMHIEKNVFENLFQTIMDTPKTKDNVKARMDVKEYCNRPSLHTWMRNNNKYMKPKASYTLTKPEVNEVCKWLKKVKFPDGYASNIGGCVNVQDGTFYSFKSHDCHVFMQRLMPIILRGMLSKQIFEPIIELCTFFRVICSKVLHIEDLKTLQKSIVVTICKLEKIFPPGFFDSMEHLVIHLSNEAILGGPVQFRWMYLYERKLGQLKRTIRNKARVEGSIVESYLVDELSNYCSLYLDLTLNTRLNREPRNFAPDILCSSSTDTRLSIFKHPSRRLYRGKPILPTDKDRLKAHTYTLLNCQELHDFIILYDEEQRALFPDCEKAILDEKKDEGFARWLQIYVLGNPVNSHIRDVAQGPLNYVQSHKGYLVNGYKFHTQTAYHGRVTENSGVCVKGASYDEHESDYYGLLDEILELEYHSSLGACIVVLFKCTWFHPVDGVRVDSKTNMVDVNTKVIGCTKDPFVLASQAQQVYYTPYPSKDKGLKDWWAVIKTSPRGVYELAEDVNIVGDDDEEDTEHFFQENERLTCASTEDLSYVTHVETNVIEEVDDVNDGDQEEEEAAFECIDSDEDADEFEDEDTD